MTTSCALCGATGIGPYRTVRRSYAGSPFVLQLERCESCGFVFLQNAPRIDYDGTYLEEEQVLTSGSELAAFRARERIAAIARFVPPAADRRFLDVGFGDGLLLSVAEAAGYATFGLDVNPQAVAVARRQFNLRATLETRPREIAFSGVMFDVIHMNEVIEHLHDPVAMLHWYRVHLGASGCLVVQTGNLDSLASRLRGAAWDYFRPVHVSYFSSATLSRALSRTGFRVLWQATVDWRLAPAIGVARRFLREGRPRDAVRFLSLYATALVPGLRRTVVMYAR